jgi:uncharacterized phage protein (TIGR01671 family)
MRTILFRGKIIGTKQWTYGQFLNYRFNAHRYYIATDETLNELIPVEPSTVGQYVGRDDPNGVKIFEGDVMKCGTAVEFNTTGIGSCGCCYEGFYGTGFIVSSDDKLYHFDKRNHVIGNIHDNPELGKDEL